MVNLIPIIYLRFFVAVIFSFTIVNADSQEYQTKEIKLNYSNGVSIFNICITNPSIAFDNKKEYFWYSENSGKSDIRSTEGGCGGNLLHGKERFFDSEGNLLFERNYHLGLLEGESKYWDSLGKLQKVYRHANGNLVYRKIKVSGGWFEDIGLPLTTGYTKRNYDDIGNITSETICNGENYFTKEYYNYGRKIKYLYTTPFWCDTCFKGKFNSYYENGNKKVEGRYSDSLINIRIGVWKWYKETGTLQGQDTYREEIQRWPNGEWKVTGGYYFKTNLKKWLKIGNWNYYDESGKLLYSKTFDFDEEIQK